jgi:uncharacterized damage-inducible protein DinB
MVYYGASRLADSFRTVRKNTILAAEEISADKYGFRPAAGARTVAELLAHIAVATRWPLRLHSEGITFVDVEMFVANSVRTTAAELMLRTKDEILAALRSDGEAFASFLDGLSEETLAEQVGFPPAIQPPLKSRLEMLLAVKEHEMHHRGQLMLIQRLLGIVPHLTRQRDAMRAAQVTARA